MGPASAFIAEVETSGGSFESEEWFTARRAGTGGGGELGQAGGGERTPSVPP